MARRRVPSDEWQYRERSSTEVRGTLLRLTLEFVLAVRELPGVLRIGMLGSLVTDKARPKDVDMLVSVMPGLDLTHLARLARRFQGGAQGINSTADVFLATLDGTYLGRVCRYRECYPRVRCQARHCGAQPHLNDDLDALALAPEVVKAPPLIVHPTVSATGTVPADVLRLLLEPLQGGGPRPGIAGQSILRAL